VSQKHRNTCIDIIIIPRDYNKAINIKIYAINKNKLKLVITCYMQIYNTRNTLTWKTI